MYASDSMRRAKRNTRDEIELLRDISAAIKQIEDGKVLTNRQAKAELRRRLQRFVRRAAAMPPL